MSLSGLISEYWPILTCANEDFYIHTFSGFLLSCVQIVFASACCSIFSPILFPLLPGLSMRVGFHPGEKSGGWPLMKVPTFVSKYAAVVKIVPAYLTSFLM